MSVKNHQSKTDVAKLIKNQHLNLDELCRGSENPMFIKYCQNMALEIFQGKG